MKTEKSFWHIQYTKKKMISPPNQKTQSPRPTEAEVISCHTDRRTLDRHAVTMLQYKLWLNKTLTDLAVQNLPNKVPLSVSFGNVRDPYLKKYSLI